MNIFKFYEVLLSKIREKRSRVEERLLNGSFDKLEDYKFVVGRLKEIEEMEVLTLELFKTFNKG